MTGFQRAIFEGLRAAQPAIEKFTREFSELSLKFALHTHEVFRQHGLIASPVPPRASRGKRKHVRRLKTAAR